MMEPLELSPDQLTEKETILGNLFDGGEVPADHFCTRCGACLGLDDQPPGKCSTCVGELKRGKR